MNDWKCPLCKRIITVELEDKENDIKTHLLTEHTPEYNQLRRAENVLIRLANQCLNANLRIEGLYEFRDFI